jgi:hypothetical protein
MADFSISNLDAYQAGQNADDTLLQVANVGRNAACSFFKAYPAVVIPNPAFDYLNGIWDGLCKNSPSGLPPAPVPPFTGGQCPTQYSVHYAWDLYDGDTLVSHTDNTTIINGNIYSIHLRNDVGDSVGVVFSFHNTFSGQDAEISDAAGFAPKNSAKNLNIISITRTDGNPDNCGNPPAVYPPPPVPPTPVVPGGNTYNTTQQNITYNNGNTYQVTPMLDLSFHIAPVIQVGGINVSIGGGGATVTPPSGLPTGNSNADINNKLAGLTKNLGDGTIGGGGVGAAAAKSAANTAPPPKPGTPGLPPPVVQPPTQHTNKNMDTLASVQIILTTLPSSRNTIFASDPQYNVYIAGWFSWLQGDAILSRQPIQYADEIFFIPSGADGYTFTITNGAAGHAIENSKLPTT